MQITDVRIRKIEKEGKMKAVVSITIDEEFVIHDIKIIEGEKGMFIAMPSRKTATPPPPPRRRTTPAHSTSNHTDPTRINTHLEFAEVQRRVVARLGLGRKAMGTLLFHKERPFSG